VCERRILLSSGLAPRPPALIGRAVRGRCVRRFERRDVVCERRRAVCEEEENFLCAGQVSCPKVGWNASGIRSDAIARDREASRGDGCSDWEERAEF
jgi:hypothetical protein